jgi:hypothetical protein
MGRCWLILISLMVLIAGNVRAQPLSPTPPQDPSLLGPWREAWYAYGREIRAWCTTHSLHAIQTCLEREMAKQGVSPAFFADLYKTAPRPTTLRTWCTATDRRRCDGTTVQTCNVQTSLWEDYQRCETVGQRCSIREEDCAGLVNWACCAR